MLVLYKSLFGSLCACLTNIYGCLGHIRLFSPVSRYTSFKNLMARNKCFLAAPVLSCTHWAIKYRDRVSISLVMVFMRVGVKEIG